MKRTGAKHRAGIAIVAILLLCSSYELVLQKLLKWSTCP